MYLADGWRDFEVLDTGDGQKLERWGQVILSRPDPQVIWPKGTPRAWKEAQAHYTRSEKGGGAWEFYDKLPERWVIGYRDLKFSACYTFVFKAYIIRKNSLYKP